jgi:hypothetical protein
MRTHSDIGVCGTNIAIMFGNVKKLNTSHFFEHDEIKASLLFNNTIPHTTVMIRSEIFKEHGYRYNEEFKIMQDYELWQRLINFTRFHLLKEELGIFRIVDDGVSGASSKKINYREDVLKTIFRSALSNLEIIPSEADINTHIIMAGNMINHSLETVVLYEEWLLKLIAKNKEICTYDNEAFRKIIHSCWFNICSRSSTIGLKVFGQYFKSQLFDFNYVSLTAIMKLFVKCLK